MSNKYREGELSKLTRRVFYMDLELLKKVGESNDSKTY